MTEDFSSNVAMNLGWVFDMEDTGKMLTFLNDTTSAMMYIVCETFDASGASLGTETSAGTMMYVPADTTPRVTSISIVRNATLDGYLVQGISTLTANAQVSAATGTTISGYETKIENILYKENPASSSVLNMAGERSVEVTAIDSRGRKHTAEKTYTVYAYAAPKVKNVYVERCDSTGSEAMIEGEKLRFTLEAESSRIHSDTINPLTVKVYAKQRISNEWNLINTYPNTTDTVNYSNYVLNGEYSNLKSYDIMFEISDKVGTIVEWQSQVGTQNV